MTDTHTNTHTQTNFIFAQVNSIMVENIHSVLERGDKLDNLEGRSAELAQSSAAFQRQAQKLKRQM